MIENTMPRAEFDALNVDDRQKFVAAGGTVIESPVLNKLSRAEFDQFSPAERMAFIKRGGKIEDPPAPRRKRPRSQTRSC